MFRFLLLLLLPAAAFGCSCMSSGPPCQAAWQVYSVFAGKVVSLDNSSGNRFLSVHVSFDVTETFPGMEDPGKRAEVFTGRGGGDCGYHFEPGSSYIVYAHRTKEGLLQASICSRTAPIESAQSDLAYLRGLKNHPLTAYVFGSVGDAESRADYSQPLGTYSRAGITGVTVTLTGSATNRKIVTEKDGAFRFDGLEPGTYNVAASKDGYSLAYDLPPFKLHAGGCGYVLENMLIDRRVTGKVRHADGSPASGITVELVPAAPTNQMSLPFPVGQAKTNEDGVYELKNIPSGKYYLGINIARTLSVEMPYGRAFYPGVPDPSRAAIITVAEIAETRAYDFSIPRKQLQRTLDGVVCWPDERPAQHVNIFLEDIHFPWQTNSVAAQTLENGQFRIAFFDGTQYRVHAVTQARYTNESTSAEPLTIVPGQVFEQPLRLILTIKGHSAAALSGKGLEPWRAGRGL